APDDWLEEVWPFSTSTPAMNPHAISSTPSSARGSGASKRRRGRRGNSAKSSSGITVSSLGFGSLLKAQRLDRSQRGGASGRVGAEEQAGQSRRTEGKKDRVRGDFRVHSGDLELAAEHADEHAGDPADERDEHGLGQELGEDVSAPGADRLADADLACALGDGHEHYVHDADPADEQRDRGDLAEQRREHAAGGARRFQQRSLVEDLKARFGGVLDFVTFLEDLTDLRFR